MMWLPSALVFAVATLAQLSSAGAFTQLRQTDFALGTYRIRTSGVYQLQEDISFSPRADNDFWNVPGDVEYPMGQFYLGFFAAITVEADDVEIDLSGYTIKQGPEFYLAQRFWNAIELADRIFVDNEGVSSLNFQTGDKLQWQQTGMLGALRPAKNVSIHDGTLGLSSHAGIHGNGAVNVHISRVTVVDFEVAGIHCNGCHHVSISDCIVGPSSSQVPVLGTFSNARFLNLYTQRLIPAGFAQDGLAHLLDETITFADRAGTPMTVRDVFQRCSSAVEYYSQEHAGTLDTSSLSSEQQMLLDEAHIVFDNKARVPDGSVVYGILFNHLGLPAPDENFYGAGLETSDINITRTRVLGLKARPVEVPALQTIDGVFVQGPARDLLRIFDVVDDGFRSLVNGEYKGNFLSDTYFALWQLSNSYYRARVYDSQCGNFGSNATLPYSFWQGQCVGGSSRDMSLNGRDVSMLQKKYFGGLSMSQSLFDWATVAGSSLHELFISDPDMNKRRQSKHFIVCDLDTMFHPMHGVVGIKLRWVKDAIIEDVEVVDIENTADDWHWLCKQEYKLPENQQLFKPSAAHVPRGAADVRGLEVVKSSAVMVRNLSVHNLDSDEGRVFGIDLASDMNDRSDYLPQQAATFEQTSVLDLRAGHGAKVVPVRMGEGQATVVGISTGPATSNHNNFRLPKVFIMYEAAGAVCYDRAGLPRYDNADIGVVDRWMARSTFVTEEKLLAFRKKVLGHLTKQYGLSYHNPDAAVRDPVWVTGTDSYVAPLELVHQFQYKGISICTDTGGCTKPSVNSFIHDYPFLLVVGPSGLVLHGAFGGDAGLFAGPGNMVFSGTYNFENFTVPGTENTGNLEVEYFGTCPVQTRPIGGENSDVATFYIDCTVESKLLGHGRATGAYVNRRMPDGRWELWGYPTQVYQDTPANPANLGIKTEDYKEVAFPTPDVTFNWIADGAYPVPVGTSGIEVFPYLYQHHWLHEAGVKYLRRWSSSYNSDAALRQLRRDFLTFLRDDYGIAAANPDAYESEPLTNQIDLGGGNTVAPYAVNHWTNQRMITKKRDAEMLQFPSLDSRLHEGGFRLFVGRAGMNVSKYGYLPFGSLVVQGAYVIEGDPDLGTHEVKFRSSIPMVVNEWSTSVLEQDLNSSTYGEGKAYIVLPAPLPGLDGITVNFRGAFVFKNAAGGWAGNCYSCPLEGPYTDVPLEVPDWEMPLQECPPEGEGGAENTTTAAPDNVSSSTEEEDSNAQVMGTPFTALSVLAVFLSCGFS